MEVIPDVIEEILEDHAIGRLPKTDVPAAFEHLMVCDECDERYESELSFKLYFREAVARGTAVELTRERNWLDWLSLAKPVWAAAAAMAVIAAFVPVLREGSGPVQHLQLSALRGAEDATVARAGNAVRLHLVTAGFDVSAAVTVQIADRSGREVWRGTATQTERSWQVKPDIPFRPGRYWVRVLDPRHADPPLREYSFTVR